MTVANQHAKDRAADPVAFIRCPMCSTVAPVFQRAGTVLRYWACPCGSIQPLKASGQAYIAQHQRPTAAAFLGDPPPRREGGREVDGMGGAPQGGAGGGKPPAAANPPPPAPAADPAPAPAEDDPQAAANRRAIRFLAALANKGANHR